MENLWEALRMAVLGIFDWDTVVIFVVVFVVYLSVAIVSTNIEN